MFNGTRTRPAIAGNIHEVKGAKNRLHTVVYGCLLGVCNVYALYFSVLVCKLLLKLLGL